MLGPGQALYIDDLTGSLQQPSLPVVPSSFIIKGESVDVTWPTLVHTGNKRLSQERIPNLLAAKDPSVASQRKPRQGEKPRKKAGEPQRWSSDLGITNILPQTCPTVGAQGALRRMHGVSQPLDRGSQESQWAQSVSLVPHVPKSCFRVTKKWPSARPSMDGPQLSTSAY